MISGISEPVYGDAAFTTQLHLKKEAEEIKISLVTPCPLLN